jgi:hypothetical protein
MNYSALRQGLIVLGSGGWEKIQLPTRLLGRTVKDKLVLFRAESTKSPGSNGCIPKGVVHLLIGTPIASLLGAKPIALLQTLAP